MLTLLLVSMLAALAPDGVEAAVGHASPVAQGASSQSAHAGQPSEISGTAGHHHADAACQMTAGHCSVTMALPADPLAHASLSAVQRLRLSRHDRGEGVLLIAEPPPPRP